MGRSGYWLFLYIRCHMQALEKWAGSFFTERGFARRQLWFKGLLYGFLLYKCYIWQRHFPALFAYNAVLYPPYQSIGGLRDLAFVLLRYPGDNLSIVFLWLCALLAFYRLFFRVKSWSARVFAVLADLGLWFLVMNLHNKMYMGLSGGNLLLNQFLLFNCFLSKSAEQKPLAELSYFAGNLGILAIRLQVMILYLVSALSKLQHSEWLQGSALQQVMRTEHFRAFEVEGSPVILGGLLILLNYLVLAYQFSFPVLVWFKGIVRLFLLVGIFMHLYIGLFMGLPEFAFVMLLGYLFFWPVDRPVSGS